MGSHSKHVGSLFRDSSQHDCENSTPLFAHHQAPSCFSDDLLIKLCPSFEPPQMHRHMVPQVCQGSLWLCPDLHVQAVCTNSEPFLKGSLRASLKNVVNISTEINWMSNFNNVSHPSSSLWEKGCWKKSRRGPVCQSLAVFLPVIANSLIKYFLLPCMPLFT